MFESQINTYIQRNTRDSLKMLKRIGTISSRVACLPLRGVNTNTELIRPFTLSALHRCDDNETRKSLRKTRPKVSDPYVMKDII